MMDNVQMETTHPKQLDDSALDRIPTNWEVTNLGNSFDELYRYPTYYGIEYVESGIPEVRGELIKADGTIDKNAGNFRYISKETANCFQRVRLEPGDFVMTVRGTMGKIAMVPERLRGAVITANLIRMKFTKSMVVPKWARHFLRSEFFQDALDLATSATTIKTIQVPALCAITFWRPPTKEQRRIAEILDTIDEIIQKTETLISKLKAMKQGLLHDLLTRGLEKNGKLRDPKAHPEQFKDSPLVRIPKEWEVRELGVTATLQRGFDLPIQDRRAGDVPIFGSNGIDGHHNESRVSGPGVITGRSGSIGFVYYTDTSFWPLNTTLYIKEFHGNRPKFIRLLLESLRLDRFTAATGVPSLNRNFVHPIEVTVPESTEQDRIVDVVEAHDARIHTEEQYRDKLKLQKKGLMHDLLTGKVRVEV